MREETGWRDVAIDRIRARMLELCEGGKSACQVATERDILCKGFKRDSDAELRQRYEAYVGGAERISRSDLERAANHWHLERQRTEQALIACDVQCRYNQVCGG